MAPYMLALDTFHAAYTNGAYDLAALPGVVVEIRQIGRLNLPSGRVIACDPAFLTEEQHTPFAQTVPPGVYPVLVSIVRFLANGDQRIGYAILQLRPEPPTRLEMALQPGQDLTRLRRNDYYGYGVDSGLGCFASIEIADALAQLPSNAAEALWDDISMSLEDPYGSGCFWGVTSLPGHSDLQFTLFASGFGDGYYPSFWGYNDQEELVCLTTDFVMVEPETEDAQPPRRSLRELLRGLWRRS